MQGELLHTAAEGNGPVNALDNALRKALVGYYPQVANFHLSDYKVRILDSDHGTEAITRVLIDTRNSTSAAGALLAPARISSKPPGALWQIRSNMVWWWRIKKTRHCEVCTRSISDGALFQASQ